MLLEFVYMYCIIVVLISKLKEKSLKIRRCFLDFFVKKLITSYHLFHLIRVVLFYTYLSHVSNEWVKHREFSSQRFYPDKSLVSPSTNCKCYNDIYLEYLLFDVKVRHSLMYICSVSKILFVFLYVFFSLVPIHISI